MPTITNPGVIEAMVLGFLTSDRNKSEGLRQAGYKPSYARSVKGMKLYERPDVLTEIKRQELDLIKKTGYSKEQATQDLIDDRQLARDLNQPSAAISANSQLIRLYGMDQMDNKRDSTVIIINPPSTSPKRVESEIING
jgi:phage terminase small subunit